MLTDYFRFREICDDEKMDVFFWRDLNIYANKYKALVRVETIDFDPMVNRYFESEFTHASSGSNNEVASVENIIESLSSNTGNSRNDAHNIGTTNNTTDNTSTSETNGITSSDGSVIGSTDTSGQTTVNSSGTTTVDNTTKSANKEAPMNAAGAGGTTGKLNNLDFTYATAYSQTDGNSETSSQDTSTTATQSNTDTSTSTHTSDTSDTTTESVGQTVSAGESENTSVTTDSFTNENASNTTSSTSNSRTSNNSGNERSRNRYTGREGLTPQQAMALASDYLMNYSTAFKWLCNNLEKNFISLYNY